MHGDLFRILLVEDNVGDIYLFQKALEDADVNFELIAIKDGAEALAFIRREGKYAESPIPDLVLLDLNLPKKGGDEILEAIRGNERFTHVPVVVTSSSASPRDQKMRNLGIERYLRKPPDLDEFMKIGPVLKQILLESKARRESPPAT